MTGARRGSIQIAEDFVLNVIEEQECLEIFGTHLSLLEVTEAEVEHRIAVAWRKFWALKALLLNNRVSRKRRLQLFDSSISSSFRYGADAWTPRTEELKKIRSV